MPMIEKQHRNRRPPTDGWTRFVTHPDEGGPFPAVIVLMDIWGLREELFDVARKIAVGRLSRHGAELLVSPRQGAVRIPRREGPDALAHAICRRRCRTRCTPTCSHLTGRDGDGRHRRGAEISRRRAGAARAEGHHRLLPGRLAVARGGGGISRPVPRLAPACTARGWSATSRIRRIASSTGCAARSIAASPSTTISRRRRPSRRSASCSSEQPNVRYRANVHAGTEHGYALPDRDIFDKPAANRDWENIFAMFRRQLGKLERLETHVRALGQVVQHALLDQDHQRDRRCRRPA